MGDPDTASKCLFCRILAGELPAEVVHETADSFAFRDIAPQAPTHVLVVPRRHATDLAELARLAPESAVDLVRVAAAVAEAEGLGGQYRLIANTGSGAGQSVFHAHLHLLGGRSMKWPPG